MPGAAGLPGRDATLVAKFEFDVGQRDHDGRHGAPSRSCGVDAFPQRTQRNPCSPRSAIVRVTSSTERPSRSIAATTTASPGRAKASIRLAGEQPLLLDPGDVQRGPLDVEVLCSDGAPGANFKPGTEHSKLRCAGGLCFAASTCASLGGSALRTTRRADLLGLLRSLAWPQVRAAPLTSVRWSGAYRLKPYSHAVERGLHDCIAAFLGVAPNRAELAVLGVHRAGVQCCSLRCEVKARWTREGIDHQLADAVRAGHGAQARG
jgi:hypothetical protein